MDAVKTSEEISRRFVEAAAVGRKEGPGENPTF